MADDAARRAAAEPEQQADEGADAGDQQRVPEQPRGAAGGARAQQPAHALGRPREHPARDLGDDEGGEQREQPVAATAARSGAAVGHGFGQRLALDQLRQHRGGVHQAAAEVAFAEPGHHVFLDHPRGGRVRDRAFQAVTRVDSHAAVVPGDHHEHAVVDRLAPELPLVVDPLRVAGDVLGRGGRHHQHLQLAALGPLQRQRLRFELPHGRGIERAGGVDHRRGQRRDRLEFLRKADRRQQAQQERQAPREPTQVHPASGCPKSTVGASWIRSTSSTVKFGFVS